VSVYGDIIVGLIGAFVGNWLVRAFHFSINLGSPIADRIVVSVAGAVLLMLIIGMLRPRTFARALQQCVVAPLGVSHVRTDFQGRNHE
jgi:uncharacterized membrane protein YeaQ/YmgE (transglycosylase-associated protein family)